MRTAQAELADEISNVHGELADAPPPLQSRYKALGLKYAKRVNYLCDQLLSQMRKDYFERRSAGGGVGQEQDMVSSSDMTGNDEVIDIQQTEIVSSPPLPL